VLVFDNIISDRGSKYAVAGGPCPSEADAKAFLKKLKKNKKHIIVVTRWYGGKHLGGDRFRHVQTAVRHYLDAARLGKT